MNGNAFDAFTRQAADAITRRTSLLTIGWAALTGVVAAPRLATAKKRGKKKNDKCKKQVEKCESEVNFFCENLPMEKDEELCKQLLHECCQHLKKCKANAATECFLQYVDPFSFAPI